MRNRVCDAHLNLADGEGEGSVAVVVADDLKLVLLADVENRGGLRSGGGEAAVSVSLRARDSLFAKKRYPHCFSAR